MRTQEIEFGQWLPDQADYKNPGLVVANNCYAAPGGYVPFEVAVATSDTTTETVAGAQKFFRNDGSSIVVGGSATRLFVREQGALTETSGLNSLGNLSTWQFERFNDLIVAVSLENDPQYLTDLDSDTTFSALPGNPPRATVVGKVLEWLVMGDLTDIASLGSPRTPNRVRWGAFNNPTSGWVTDRGNQSDFRDLDAKYGKVTGIVGGRFGLVFQERAIWRMVYVGAPKVFDFELVADDRGCVAPGSLVTIGYQTYFLDQSGLFVTNGSAVEPLGDQRVNEYFEANVDVAQISLTHGAVNWPKRAVAWTFRSRNADGYQNQIIYNFVTERFTSATQSVDYLVQTSQDALTLGDLAALFPGGLGTLSAFQLGNLDWQGTSNNLGAFIASGAGSAYSSFTGSSAEAEFVTGDFAVTPGRRTLVDGVMPIVEMTSGTPTTAIRSRALQGNTVSSTPSRAQGADGYCPHHVDNWFHSVRTVIPAGSVWENARGLWVRGKATGRR